MSDTTATVHESYAFACMRCGHGWEQSYEITHHVDATGREHVVYTADGERVPSPLSRPTCLNCDGHLVRIMRAGQVSSASGRPLSGSHARADVPGPTSPAGPLANEAEDGRETRSHWHLADLFHRK